MSVEIDIAGLIPHAGRMCLLQRILRWDTDSLTAATATHRDPANPLAVAGRLRSVHLCEYGAQAMAVHGGMLARASGSNPHPGLLVSLRDVQFGCACLHDLDGEIFVEVRRIHASDTAWQYFFHATHAGQALGHGRATVSLASAT